MDHELALWWIGWTYVAVNTGRALSYVPQIAAVWRCSDGAQSISLMTWSYWSFSHLTAALYAGMVLDDWKLLAVSIGNLACCTSVLLLAANRRASQRSRRRGGSHSRRRENPGAAALSSKPANSQPRC